MHSKGDTFASWVKERAVHGAQPAASTYDKYSVAKHADRPPDAASRLSSLDYYNYDLEDERTWRSTSRHQAFSKEKRFPRLKQYDTKGRTFGFRKKKVVLHERFHDLDRGRRRQQKRR